MIEQLTQPSVSEFNKDTLKKLKPYFDKNIVVSSIEDRHQWFRNLLTLAKHNLSISHCIQHNHAARIFIETSFEDTNYPKFYDPTYENLIGCYSGVKHNDSIELDNNIVFGTKHWISMVHQADFGIFSIKTKDTVAYVLIDFAEVNSTIDKSCSTAMGMEIARPASLSVNNYILPDNYMLGERAWATNTQTFFRIICMHDYCFITNYLGLIISLYEELKNYIEQYKLIGIDFEFKKLGLDISALTMLWEDNLTSTDTMISSDNFWHRRNTQYTMSKTTLIKLISLILQVCDSRWLDANSPNNQRFRDALTFCSHMEPVYKNLTDKHFVKF